MRNHQRVAETPVGESDLDGASWAANSASSPTATLR
jgi:hypothetical protein